MIPEKSFSGILFVGDPHVEGRCPDFRSDDYPNVILEKLQWIMNHCIAEKLLPVFLGDIFDKPRNTPTWIIVRLIEMLLNSNAIGIYGNHDCAEPTLSENDSFSILVKSGCLQLVSREQPWRGRINGRSTLIGGSSYRQRIPDSIVESEFLCDSLFPEKSFGVWLSHHDIISTEYEAGRFSPFAIENIDILVNGHIHTRGEPVQKGGTLWLTPGNISRRSRSTNCRHHTPSVLKVTLEEEDFHYEYVEVPHRSFDEVFHDPVASDEPQDQASAFVAGLSELRYRKTSSGAGLKEFLKKNLDQFSEPVADEIRTLASSITGESI